MVEQYVSSRGDATLALFSLPAHHGRIPQRPPQGAVMRHSHARTVASSILSPRPLARPLARPLPMLLLALLLALCACARPQPLRLELAHLNDTHSNLEPVDERLVLQVDGQPQAVRAKIGGMARLKTALDAARSQTPGLVLLHAGDAVQGTLYFNVFHGRPEFELLNALGVDAMCLGNHEFDKGPQALGRMLALARFPVLAANVDASKEPALAGRWRPYAILRVPTKGGTEPVGVIGPPRPPPRASPRTWAASASPTLLRPSAAPWPSFRPRA
jgi:5'-nucleotidase